MELDIKENVIDKEKKLIIVDQKENINNKKDYEIIKNGRKKRLCSQLFYPR